MEFNAFLYGAGVVLLVCFGSILLCAIVGALGFTPAGVLAGSCASGWQSVIGNVVKGSCFAILQSLAATRLLCNCACLAAIVATATIVALIYYFTGFDFDGFGHDVTNKTTAIYHNITTMVDNMNIASSTFTEPVNKVKAYVDEFDFDDFKHSVNATSAAVYNNITTMVDNMNITSSTFSEPMSKIRSFIDGICKNCTNIFS